MKYHRLLGFILVFSLTSGFAQDVTPILPTGKNKQQEIKVLPMPGNLNPGWWNYFAASGTDLKQRTEEAARRYARLIQQIAPEQRSIAGQYVDKILINLRTLLELASADADRSQDASLENFKASYSIDEWLVFATHLESEKIDVENQSERINRSRSELKAALKRINNMMLAYMELAEDGNKKLLFGLEMMMERTAIAVKEAQLKLNKQSLDIQSAHLNQMLKFNEGIAARLVADQTFLKHTNQALKQLDKSLTVIQKKLSSAQSETIGLMGKDPLQRAQARLNDQKVINALIEEAIVEINIATLKSEKDLATLLLEPDRKQVNVFLKNKEKALQLIDELTRKVNSWRMSTANEMSQVQISIMGLAPDDSSIDLRKLYQRRIDLTQQSLASLKQFELEKEKLSILLDEIGNRLAQRAGKLGTLINWSAKQAEDFKSNFVSWWTETLFAIGDTPVSAFGLLRVLLIIAIASGISFIFRRVLLRIAERKNMDGGSSPALYTVGRLAHYVILLIGIIIALSSIGLDFTNLALVAGALSVGIGFGLQSVVNNFVSGLILLFEGTLKIGDFIEIESGVTGIVREINVRSTLINTNDNVDIIVPNSVLVSDRVTNWTLREANRRIHVPFGVAYGTDKNLVKKAALEAASKVRFTNKLKRGEAAQCWLVNFGDSSLDFELVVWINQEAIRKPGTVHATYLWEIETSLREHGIEIPFPQRDLHVRTVFGRDDQPDWEILGKKKGRDLYP
ncbi:MAG: mechanosensitive ion channel domain-containing protein [Gammaproteobacteria bacterium]